MITGLTLIRNGNYLKYPWKECIRSMSAYCDEVLVNVGDSLDDTEEEARRIAPNVRVFNFEWDMSNTGDGRELAKQANNLLPHVNEPWVCYLQADEFIAEWDAGSLTKQIEELYQCDKTYTQVELFRTYFYSSLKKRDPAHEIWLGRIFKTGTHEIGGDGMHLVRKEGRCFRSAFNIYHYSRIGTEEEITNRVRILDRLFHSEEEVSTMDPFVFGSNELIQYDGPHPKEALSFYKKENE